MKQIIAKKLELWILLLLAIFFFLLGLFFAGATRYYALGGAALGGFGPVLDGLAALPERVYTVLRYKGFGEKHFDLRAGLVDRFPDAHGFRFFYPAGSKPDAPYLLLNRFDADLGHSVVEFWDLNNQVLTHSWRLTGLSKLWSDVELRSSQINIRRDRPEHRFRGTALLQPDGSLVVSDETPLIKVSPCSEISLLVDASIFHHSVERASDGSLWVARYKEPKSVSIGRQNFVEDVIVNVSENGVILHEKSVIKILEENGLEHLVYGQGGAQDDPIHLNDIEPVLLDGRFWRAGDVFLSLRNRSMLLLYRPKTGKVLWFRQGPWLHQHDVGVLADGQISVFNNRAYRVGVNGLEVRDVNNVLIYDFETDSVRSPWQLGFEKNAIRTVTEGRGTVLNNSVFVEESNFGRLLEFDGSGTVSWSYVNRATNGHVYVVSWSRIVEPEFASSVLNAIEKARCSELQTSFVKTNFQ